MTDGHWVVIRLSNGDSVSYQAPDKISAEGVIEEIKRCISTRLAIVKITNTINEGYDNIVINHIVAFSYTQKDPDKED